MNCRLRVPAFHGLLLLLTLVLAACGGGGASPADPFAGSASWSDVERQARGQTVDLMMWNGDPFINHYMQDFVAPALRDSFGITLRISAGQGGEIVTALMGEIEAGRAAGAYDLVWINGETFYQLRQIDALYGPFAHKLPAAQFVDYDNPFIGLDFQQPVEGFEAPWGNVQLALIYDSARVARPPQTRDELAAWVRANPGRFTFDAAFTGMTFLKALLVDFAGGPGALDGPFDGERYARASARLWQYLNGIKPFLWKEGAAFPPNVAQLHQLFVGGEVDFTMSNNDAEVDNKVLLGLFPPTARAYVPAFGSIQNSHYLGIPRNGADKAGALVAINFLESPAAQYEKMRPEVWGDGTVLSMDKLPPAWRDRFAHIPSRRLAPPRADIAGRALQELAPEYMIRLYDDFRANVVE